MIIVLATDGGASETPDVTPPTDTDAAETIDDAAETGETVDDAAPVDPQPDITEAANTSAESDVKDAGEVVMGEDNEATAPETVATDDAKEPVTPKTPRDRLNDLEKAYKLMAAQTIEAREAAPLRDLYLALSQVDEVTGTDSETKRVAAYARARARQLGILIDLQKRRQELRAINERLALARDETDAARLSIQSSGQYVAVGRLAVSTVYDGSRLPRLLRVQDPGTGRTIAYVRPDDRMDYVGMLGQPGTGFDPAGQNAERAFRHQAIDEFTNPGLQRL